MTIHLLRAVQLLCVSIVCTACLSEIKLPVEESEKLMLLRAGDLAPYGYELEGIERYESFTKTRLSDGSYELEYEFETPDSEEEHPLFLYVIVTVEKNDLDAVLSHGAERFGAMHGLRKGGIKEREVKNFYRYGDVSSFHVLEMDGQPVGNLFSARKGRRIYTLMITGMSFDDPQVWRELLQARLRQFSTYSPAS